MVIQTGQVRCFTCGRGNALLAIACTNCGGALRTLKDRSVAILLALFLSFVTWSYTYRRDARKFWLGLVLTVASGLLALASWGFAVVGVAVWIVAVVDATRRDERWYLDFPYGEDLRSGTWPA